MRMLAFIRLLLLPLLCHGAARAGEGGRTDINPALLYAQAIAVMPNRSQQDHLFTNEWRGQDLDEQFNDQIATYNSAFKLLRHAARQTAPCDWGYDLSEGPQLLLPSLAKAKTLSQVARLRLRWHLENGRPEDARDDLLAAFVLGRQLSTDRILISALVQIAIENLLASGIAENWFRMSAETRRQIIDGLDSAPARGTMAQCVPTERLAFRDWLARKIQEFVANSRDETEALQKTRDLLSSVMTGGDDPEASSGPTPEAILQSAGGTTTGLLQQLEELNALYDQAARLMMAPYDQYLSGIKEFNEQIAQHPNLMARVFFPAFEKCRLKEFAIETKLAMLKAAAAFQESGESGLRQVSDPLFHAPFEYRRFEFAGVDRGFELRSRLTIRNWAESLIFIERDGPPFYLDGPSAGKAIK